MTHRGKTTDGCREKSAEKRVLQREKKERVTPFATGRGQDEQIALPSLVKTMSSARLGGGECEEQRRRANRGLVRVGRRGTREGRGGES